MQIAYISTYLPQPCGIATYTHYLIQGIKAVDKDIGIKVVAEKGSTAFNQGGIETITCWDRKENYIEPIIAHTAGVDIIHIQHEYGIYQLDDRFPSVLRELDSQAKKIITLHCVRSNHFSNVENIEEFTKEIAELADVVIVHLESAKQILLRLSVSSKKIHVIPHGTELIGVDQQKAREKLGLPKEGKIILMFGFVKRHKCHHIAMEALNEILGELRDVYLFIAGGLAPNATALDKEYIRLLESKMYELGIKERVIFPNRFFSHEDVPYVMGSCDLVLFPYYEEDRSSSGSLHLSLGGKKPVVASRIPKFDDLGDICDELLLLPHNSQGIAKIVLRLFQEPEFKEYVLDKIEKYRRETSWQMTAKRHLEVYKGVKNENSYDDRLEYR